MKPIVPLASVALFCAPFGAARNNGAYPSEKVTEFVIAKLDVNSLPSVFRPKKEKGKKTFEDYGFKAQTVEESEAIVEAPSGGKVLKLKILDHESSGIYVCVAETGESGSEPKTQSVVFLKRKDPNALLKGRESFREYSACPVIGGSARADSYGGY